MPLMNAIGASHLSVSEIYMASELVDMTSAQRLDTVAASRCRPANHDDAGSIICLRDFGTRGEDDRHEGGS